MQVNLGRGHAEAGSESDPYRLEKQSKSMWPHFDFRSLPISSESRKQLFGIYDYVRSTNKVPHQRTQLLRLIAESAFVEVRGAYVPLSPHVYLVGKLPDHTVSG